MVKKQKVLALLAISIFAASVVTYAYATVIGHASSVTNFQGVSATFVDDSGVWSISANPANSGFACCAPNPALFIESDPIAPSGTSSASPAVLNPSNYVSRGVGGGDWNLVLFVTNNTDVPASKTWSITITTLENGVIYPVTTLYFATSATLASSLQVQVWLDLTNSATLVTPLAVTATIHTVP